MATVARRRTSHRPSAPRASSGALSKAVKRHDSAEDLLMKAMDARSPAARARFAEKGLASRAPLDKTIHALLLRQLSIAHYEGRRFDRAHEVALQALELGVLIDVLQQDAARAAIGAGDVDAAVAHFRVAARRAPASRRAFHLWTLGGLLFLTKRYSEAAAALTRAVRWGTRDKPLFRAHLALVRLAMGEKVDDLQETIDDLAAAPCGRGYGRFVLGHLAYAAGEWDTARLLLTGFVERSTTVRVPELSMTLAGELRMSRATLAKMESN